MNAFLCSKYHSVLVSLLVVIGCTVDVPKGDKLSEVEGLYDKEQYQDALNVARFNLKKDSDNPDPASVVTVWKVQVIQGTKSIDYVQQFYFGAKETILDFGPPSIPYLGRGLMEDSYNTVRLFCLYAMAEFDDTLSTNFIARVFEPTYTLGPKPGNVTLEFLRGEAATVMGNRRYIPAFEGVAALAETDDAEIASKVAIALGSMGDKRAIPFLEEISKKYAGRSNDSWVAEMAENSLKILKGSQ